MEYLSNRLTKYILKKGLVQEENYAIYQYGFQCFLEIFVSVICSIIIAVSLGMELECFMFFIFFIPLRSYAGGLHMDKYHTCLLLSCITLFMTLLMVKYLSISSFTSFILYSISLFTIKYVGAVNHPNREVSNHENTIFTKKTNLFLLLSLIAAILFLFTSAERFLFLESLVFILVAVTLYMGKLKYKVHK